MCFLNALQQFRFERYRRYHQTQLSLDHLFWRVVPQMKDHQFAWILWYIWKAMNNKVFSNLDIDPLDTLKLAEIKSTLWA